MNRDGRLAYTNVGISMMPLIREGRDVMIIEKRDISMLKRYDAVLFRRESIKGRGKYILHRILKILPNGTFYVVGDNCTNGEIIKPSQVLGVLTAIHRNGKLIDFDSFVYKMYIWTWCAPFHLRFAVLHIKRFLRRFYGFILRKLRIWR